MVARGCVAVALLLAGGGCDSKPEAGAQPAPSAIAPSAAPVSAFGAGDVPPHAQLAPRPSAAPLDAKAVREHWRSAARYRLWWRRGGEEVDGGGAASRLHQLVLTDDEVKVVLEAVGDRTPAMAADCAPCATLLSVIAEDRMGLQLGSLELGCREGERVRFHGAASDACATLEADDLTGLLRFLWAITERPPRPPSPAVGGGRAQGPAGMP